VQRRARKQAARATTSNYESVQPVTIAAVDPNQNADCKRGRLDAALRAGATMPLPATHTYDTFVAFLQGTVSEEIATDLGWTDTDETDGSDYDQQINEVLRALGYTQISEVPASKVREMELRGAVAIWKKVLSEYVRAYDTGGAARTLSRDQLFRHAQYMYAQAQAALDAFITGTNDDIDRGLVNGSGYSTSIPIKIGFPRLYG